MYHPTQTLQIILSPSRPKRQNTQPWNAIYKTLCVPPQWPQIPGRPTTLAIVLWMDSGMWLCCISSPGTPILIPSVWMLLSLSVMRSARAELPYHYYFTLRLHYESLGSYWYTSNRPPCGYKNHTTGRSNSSTDTMVTAVATSLTAVLTNGMDNSNHNCS